MDKWEYKAELLGQAERQREEMLNFFRRSWLVLVAMALGIAGAVFVGLTFQTTRTETSGHLWWKDTTTTEIPPATRLVYLIVGLFLLAGAALCVHLWVRRARRQAAQKKYIAILTGVEVLTVQEIAAKTNLSRSAVYRDIQGMIDAGVIDDFYIDYNAERVVSRKYIPKTSRKTVVTCSACGANNELIVGITRTCAACGEPLVLNAT